MRAEDQRIGLACDQNLHAHITRGAHVPGFNGSRRRDVEPVPGGSEWKRYRALFGGPLRQAVFHRSAAGGARDPILHGTGVAFPRPIATGKRARQCQPPEYAQCFHSVCSPTYLRPNLSMNLKAVYMSCCI